LDPWQDEDLCRLALRLTHRQRQRIADQEPRRLDHPPPAPGEANVHPHLSRPLLTGGERPADERLDELCGWRGKHPLLHAQPDRKWLLLLNGGRTNLANDLRPERREPDP